MASEPVLVALNPAVVRRSCSGSSTLSDFWELTKPEIIFLIAITTAAGFWMASRASFSEFPWISFRFDAQMRRTA
jgi:heme O synthase-like polyprenyltransferase